MKKTIFGLIFVMILVLAINGCSSDKPYEPPSKVELSSPQITGEITKKLATPPDNIEKVLEQPKIETQKQPEPNKIKVFNIGDTATDNELKVTVNRVRFTSKIDEKNNEFSVAEAEAGKQYVIVDLTVENILPDKSQTGLTAFATQIVDREGYTYTVDWLGLAYLDKSFKDGDILPGMKKRGELAYLVPSDAMNLKFIYKFDLFTGTTAVFDVK